jgi:hypothetical protein
MPGTVSPEGRIQGGNLSVDRVNASREAREALLRVIGEERVFRRKDFLHVGR